MRVLEALKKFNRVVIVDQADLEKEYGFSWEEINDFFTQIEPLKTLISDKEVDGFEEAVWEFEIEGLKIRETTTYGIGAITELEII